MEIDIPLLVDDKPDTRTEGDAGRLTISLAVIAIILGAMGALFGIFYLSGILFQLATSRGSVDYDLLNCLSLGAMVVPVALLILVLLAVAVALGACSAGAFREHRGPGRWQTTTLE